MRRGPSSRGHLNFTEPMVKRSFNRRVIYMSIGNTMVIRIGINVGNAEVEAIKGADLDGIEAIISFDEIIVKGLEFPIVGILPSYSMEVLKIVFGVLPE